MDRSLLIDNVPVSEYDLYYESLPIIPTPERDVEYVTIRGRQDGQLTKKYGYLNIEYPINLYFYENDSFRKVYRQSKHHLLNAKTISFADDEDVFYKVKSVQIDDADSNIFKIGMFTVTFTLDPFQYEANNDPVIITESTTITNDGYDSLPIINAEISGNGRIYINDNEIVIKDTNGAITIDSEQQNAYRKGAPPQNMNNRMVGQFPVLKSGNNTISFNDDVTSLEIILNKRWR